MNFNKEFVIFQATVLQIGDLLWGWKLATNAKFQCNISKITPARAKTDFFQNYDLIRWMATERIYRKRHTIQSDVWAFGVLMAEIATSGKYNRTVIKLQIIYRLSQRNHKIFLFLFLEHCVLYTKLII